VTDDKTKAQLLEEIEALQAQATALEQAATEHVRIEKVYRILVEQSAQGMVIFQGDGIVFISPHLTEIVGYPAEGLLAMSGESLLALVHPEDRERLAASWAGQPAETADFQSNEYRILHKDGSVRWAEAFSRPITYQGQPAVLGIFLDVTERKLAEEALERERQAFRIIAEAAGRADSATDLCQQTLEGLIEILGFDIGSIRLYNERERVLERTAVVGVTAKEADSFAPAQSIDDPYYIAAHVARTREAVFAPNVSGHAVLQTHAKRIEEIGAQAIISWPILDAEKNLLGTIQMMAYQPKRIAEAERLFFETVPRIFATVLARQQAEETLRASEEKYRTLFETAPEAIALVGLDGTITDCNNATVTLAGLPKEAIIGRPFTALSALSEQDLPGYVALLRQVIEGGAETTGPINVRMARHDGSSRLLEAFITPVTEDDIVTAIQVITRDITDRKEAEAALRASEARYRALAENSPVGIWQVNADGYTAYANPAMRALLEIGDQDEVVGLHHDDFLIQYQSKRDQVRALREQGISSSYEAKLRGSRGITRDVIIFGSPILSADGAFHGTIGTVLDITDRRRMEAELRASEERYRALAENSPTGIWQVDPDGNTLYANPAMRALLGVASAGEIGARSSSPFFTPESMSKIEGELGRRREGFPSIYEAELVRKDGEHRSVIVSGAPVAAEDGELRYTIASFIDVTESKQIEAALRESEARFRLLAENVMDGFWIQTGGAEDCRTLYVNPAFERIFGVSSEEVLKSEGAWTIPLHPEDRDRVVAAMIAFSLGKADYNIEYRIIRADGDVRWILARASAISNGASLIVGIAQDITERKRAEEELRQRASQLALINQVASQIASVLDLDTLMKQAAELTQATFGYEHVGLFLLDPAREEVVMRARAGEYIDRFPPDHRLKLGRGMVGWVAQHGEPLLANDVRLDSHYINPFLPEEIIRAELSVPIRVGGKVVGVFDVQSQQPGTFDITDGVVIETLANELATAIQNARLYEQAQGRADQLALLNEITRIGTATLNLDDLLQTLADSAAGIIGGDQCYITLWDEENQRPIPAAATGPVRETYRQLPDQPGEQTLTESMLREGRPLAVEDTFNTPYMSRRIAEQFPAKSILALPLQADGRYLGALLIAFNTPHRFTEDEIEWATQVADLLGLAIVKARAYATLEHRVRERTAELEAAHTRVLELDRLKDEFVANVSHELRTPITNLRLYHHLLTERPDKQATYLDTLQRETMRLENIVEDLLYLSQLDRGEIPLNLMRLDINPIVEDFIGDRSALAAAKKLDLKLDRTPNLPLVEADRLLLERVLGHLLSNSFSYTPSGGHIVVTTAAKEGEGESRVGFTISNDGPAIPPDELPRLFERFFRGQTARQSGVPGTGLGLPIAKEIIERHGGTITAESGLSGMDQGVAFHVWLPVAKE
jgi:PAS domain S-box-containing protein